MSSVNKAILIGYLGRDPEIRSTQDGRRVANLSIATSDRWTDKQSGEKRERTEWHRVVIFNDNLVNIVERFCKKGSMVYIEGKIRTRKWTDQQGVEKYSTEITLENFGGAVQLLNKVEGGDDENQDQGSDSYDRGRAVAGAANRGQPDILDDDIPF